MGIPTPNPLVLASICAGIPFLVGLFYVIPRAAKGMNLVDEKINIGTYYHLYCQLCGYRWNWDNRTPYPKANVRPDLITQGEQRLEAERKKQQDDAAALYYLTHKK